MFCLFVFSGCSNEIDASFVATEKKSLVIANWNLQTFFDSQYDGTEYTGFTSKDKNWTNEKYTNRLERLCSVIEQIDADIIAFEEIENKGIIYDIINHYSIQGRRDKAYNYACFTKEENQAFGIALLSRYPILDYSVHQIDVRGQRNQTEANFQEEILEQPRMRPIMKALVQIGGNKKDENNISEANKVISVYVCHWKSKSGGQDESEIWRDFSENQIAHLLSKEQYPFFITGDFNRDLTEFNIDKHSKTNGFTGNVRFGHQYLSISPLEEISVNSAWLSEEASQNYKTEGTYYFQGRWEKLDHFFFGSDIQLKSFSTVKLEENTTASGTPYRYSVWDGKGVSDHLPIVCVLEF